MYKAKPDSKLERGNNHVSGQKGVVLFLKHGQSKKNIRLLSHNDLNGFGNGGQIVVSRIGKKRLAFVSHMKGNAFSILAVRDSSKPEVLYQHEAYS